VATEFRAGLATFLTMAYIMFVNPAILAQAGWTTAPCSSPPALPPPSARC
jgi:xanthine/uracil/vitamin C permease (AzgA family)